MLTAAARPAGCPRSTLGLARGSLRTWQRFACSRGCNRHEPARRRPSRRRVASSSDDLGRRGGREGGVSRRRALRAADGAWSRTPPHARLQTREVRFGGRAGAGLSGTAVARRRTRSWRPREGQENIEGDSAPSSAPPTAEGRVPQKVNGAWRWTAAARRGIGRPLPRAHPRTAKAYRDLAGESGRGDTSPWPRPARLRRRVSRRSKRCRRSAMTYETIVQSAHWQRGSSNHRETCERYAFVVRAFEEPRFKRAAAQLCRTFCQTQAARQFSIGRCRYVVRLAVRWGFFDRPQESASCFSFLVWSVLGAQPRSVTHRQAFIPRIGWHVNLFRSGPERTASQRGRSLAITGDSHNG